MNQLSSTPRAHVRATFALAVAGLVAAACASAGAAGWTFAPLPPTPSASAAPSGSPGASASPAPTATPATSASPGASPSAGGTVIELEETNTLQILQGGQAVTELHFTIGQTYTFHINNTAGFDHDFYLGPPERLEANDVDGLPGVPVNQQGMQEFTWTVSADAQGWEFACTVLGHYPSMHGMVMLDGQ